jgi:hypothetical protein
MTSRKDLQAVLQAKESCLNASTMSFNLQYEVLVMVNTVYNTDGQYSDIRNIHFIPQRTQVLSKPHSML